MHARGALLGGRAVRFEGMLRGGRERRRQRRHNRARVRHTCVERQAKAAAATAAKLLACGRAAERSQPRSGWHRAMQLRAARTANAAWPGQGVAR